jgi:hypothetical protein
VPAGGAHVAGVNDNGSGTNDDPAGRARLAQVVTTFFGNPDQPQAWSWARAVDSEIGRIETLMRLNDEEIRQAIARHPGAAARLKHANRLLYPTCELLEREPVYRAHVRELLERIAAGQDTRLGTTAECCVVMTEVSLRIPFNLAGRELFDRLLALSGLGDEIGWVDRVPDLTVGVVDQAELDLRRRLSQADRHLPPGR